MAYANIRRTPKKTAAVILSLSLSLILLNGTVTIVSGFDMDKYIKESIVSDFYMTDASMTNPMSMEAMTDRVSPELVEEVEELDGVTDGGCVYMEEYERLGLAGIAAYLVVRHSSGAVGVLIVGSRRRCVVAVGIAVVDIVVEVVAMLGHRRGVVVVVVVGENLVAQRLGQRVARVSVAAASVAAMAAREQATSGHKGHDKQQGHGGALLCYDDRTVLFHSY